jgi:hypothetical protein
VPRTTRATRRAHLRRRGGGQRRGAVGGRGGAEETLEEGRVRLRANPQHELLKRVEQVDAILRHRRTARHRQLAPPSQRGCPGCVIGGGGGGGGGGGRGGGRGGGGRGLFGGGRRGWRRRREEALALGAQVERMHARQQDARGEVRRQQAQRQELRGGGVGAERETLRRQRVERGQAREGEREERQQREGLRQKHRVGHLDA